MVDGTLDGTAVHEMTTYVVDGTVTYLTVDGTQVIGIKTGDGGKLDGAGIESVKIDGVDGTHSTTITYDDTIGISDGMSDNGIDDGMIVVIDGATTIVCDVVKL